MALNYDIYQRSVLVVWEAINLVIEADVFPDAPRRDTEFLELRAIIRHHTGQLCQP